MIVLLLRLSLDGKAVGWVLDNVRNRSRHEGAIAGIVLLQVAEKPRASQSGELKSAPQGLNRLRKKPCSRFMRFKTSPSG
jgi:hypothetical protein